MKIVQGIINISTAVLFGLVAITATSSAQTPVTPTTTQTIATPPPASLPVGNMAMLRAYALERVAGSSISIWGEAMMEGSNSVTNIYFHPEVSPPLDDAMKAIASSHFSFKVSDKTKPLNVFAELHDKNGMSLFYGNINASISNAGQIVCPAGVKMKMNSYLPIYVGENILGASVLMGDGNRQSLNVWNGYVFFNEGYAGKDGMLVLEYSDGNISQQIGYALHTGVQVPLFAVLGNINAYVQDFKSYHDKGMLPSGIMYVHLNGLVGSDHEAPVASITITSARFVKFSCVIHDSISQTIVEYPANGWFYKKDGDTETPVVLPLAGWSEEIKLEPGQYFFYPETNLFEALPPPSNGGGKG
jgi:hypothetical protein